MLDQVITERSEFCAWAHHAKEGRVVVYHTSGAPRNEEMFAYARKLFDSGKVILYQRKVGKSWEYCAQRCSCRASAWINRLSAGVHAPVGRYAYS